MKPFILAALLTLSVAPSHAADNMRNLVDALTLDVSAYRVTYLHNGSEQNALISAVTVVQATNTVIQRLRLPPNAIISVELEKPVAKSSKVGSEHQIVITELSSTY